jgi:SOS response associated peptidase (SRAP)
VFTIDDAQTRYLALGYAGHSHGLHQVIDRTRGDALYIVFLDHCREGLLGHPPWLKGRYGRFLPAEALARLFGTVNRRPNLEQTWNMAPTRDAPVVRLHPSAERHLDSLKWGLVSYFTKDRNRCGGITYKFCARVEMMSSVAD